jgi:hypothetical protein
LVCPQPKQVASESMHGARLAAQQLSRGRDTCDVEAGKPFQEAAGWGRVEAVAATTQQHHSKPTSTFAQSVINMVGMLIGKNAYATYTYIYILCASHFKRRNDFMFSWYNL